ncbi:Polypeptide N-acetylgalactosaminyltransferase 1 [Halotydeus destructor]|nr:Polypeptide N-acetylgalactosaminyltransferase 1 [Halotydeus destructor]
MTLDGVDQVDSSAADSNAIKTSPTGFLFRLSLLSLLFGAIAFVVANYKFVPQEDRFRKLVYDNSSIFPPFKDEVLLTWSSVGELESNPSDWPGENGKPYSPPEPEAEQVEKFKLHYFNVLASERIAFNRTVPDKRFTECLSKKYPEKLPSTSIVIVFHNEAWSTLLRTVHSVLRMSPRELLQEIILVDDASTKTYLKDKLDNYINQLNGSVGSPVRIIRMPERKGLIHARMIGSNEARGQVLTFLDAHCECGHGWLEPLLSRVAEDRTRVVSPIIDVIDDQSFAYLEATDRIWGGFGWKMTYRWEPIPEREDIRRAGDRTSPLRPPAFAGGIFSMDREFFNYLGKYDPEMKIWGGENIELGLRVWNCGGSLELVPCSRVGHVFRMETPYTMPGGKERIVNGNTVRIVDLWLDSWMMFFYNLYPYTLEGKEGDVNSRREITKKNKCKGFEWFREHIYPESTIPTEYRYMGQIEHTNSYKCLDTTHTGQANELGRLKSSLRHCFWNQHPHLSYQQFVMSGDGRIYHDQFCLDYDHLDSKQSDKSVLLAKCNNGTSQTWTFAKSARTIVHEQSKMCLDYQDPEMTLTQCSNSKTQKWFMRNNFDWDPPSHREKE